MVKRGLAAADERRQNVENGKTALGDEPQRTKQNRKH